MYRLITGITVISIALLATISYSFFISKDLGSSTLVEIFAFAQTSNDTFEDSRSSIISNNLSDSKSNDSATLNSKPIIGTFEGAGDGIHNAEGMAKVITLQDGNRVLRLENLKATNGPDLYIYLATDKGASDFVDLGRLKGNIGNQNYNIPQGTDLTKYNTVIIWCKQFSVLFGSAKLASL